MKIYTVIRLYQSGEMDQNSIRSFTTYNKAEEYYYQLEKEWGSSNIEIVENILD